MTDLFAYAEEQARRGALLRDEGMARALAGSEGWAERAYAALVSVAGRQATVHRDDLDAIFSDPPRHPNAWGAIWMRGIRAGVIEHSGQVRRTIDERKHAHSYPVYRSLIA